jgi:AcrR family transcriptional regulator
MARLAESLGFTTMSLYRYVASKDDVLMLMSDRAAGVPVPSGPEVGDWRARLELLLEQMQPVLAAHPWMSRTTNLLFAIGPNRLAWMEAMVAALDDTPLSEAQKLQAVGALSSHQLEWARLVDADQSRRRTLARTRGSAEPTVEDDPNAVIGRLLTPDDHPALARVVAAGVFGDAGPASGQDPDALDFGTTLILDGIASLIDRAASRA